MQMNQKKVLIIITKRLACHQVVLQLKNSLVFVKCAHIKKPSENVRTHWIVRYVLDYGQICMSVCVRARVYMFVMNRTVYINDIINVACAISIIVCSIDE